jgi:hypothetical protein
MLWMLRIRLVMLLLIAVSCGVTPLKAADCPKYEGRVVAESVWHLPEYHNAGPYDPGDYEKKLLEDLTFVDCDGERYTAKKGIVVNGASIPRPAWTPLGYTPWSGKSEKPAIIHDDQCERVVLTSNQVHNFFHKGLRHQGVDYIRAGLMYAAVKSFGPQWEKPGGPVRRPTWNEGLWNAIVWAIRSGSGLKVFSDPQAGSAMITVSPVPNALKLDGTDQDRKEIDELLSKLDRVSADFQQLNLGNRLTLQDLTAGKSLTYQKPQQRQ